MKKILLLATAVLLVVSCHVPKTFVILGDSYSTFKGHIPEGNAVWYTDAGRPGNDVTAVEQTWWYQFAEHTGLQLLDNNSYSGSTVCNTGYNGEDYSDRSFITRMPQTLQYKPDLVLIFGGTNDSWSGAPVGELQFSGWTAEDLYKALPAYCYMLDFYKKNAPRTRVVCIMNDGLKPEITSGMVAACEHYDVDYVMLEGIDKGDGHPTIKGMTQICGALESYIQKFQK